MVADYFKPEFGVVALKYGLLALVPFYLLTIIAHLIAAHSIKNDATLAAQFATAHPAAALAV